MSISAKQVRMDEILSISCEYIIPLFQRKYVWEEPEWRQLWEDLKNNYLEYSRCDNNGAYREMFLGTILVQDIDEEKTELNKILVIDGQQRLITISLLLAVIRDFILECNKKDEKLSLQVENIKKLLTNSHSIQKYKIKVSEKDFESYKLILDGSHISQRDHNNRIFGCYSFLKSRVELFSHDINLSEFLHASLQHINLVYVEIGENINAYEVFQSLNFLGKPLSQIDLVRNFFFMKISDKEEALKTYLDYWKPLEDKFGNNSSIFEDLIKQYLKNKGYEISGNNKIYSTIYDEFKDQGVDKIKKLLFDISDFSNLKDKYLEEIQFLKIEGASNQFIQELKDSLCRIKIIDHSSFNALILIYCRNFDEVINDYSSEKEKNKRIRQFIEIISLLETFAIRSLLCTNFRKVEPVIIHICRKFSYNQFDYSFSSLLTYISKFIPDDCSFGNAIKNLNIYQQNQKLTDFVLRALEYHKCKQESHVWTSTSYTIEHIMPQTLDKKGIWKKSLGQNYSLIHREWLHKLANLTITDRNSEYSNKPYSDKRKLYCESGYQLNSFICENYPEWNEDSLKSRSEFLMKDALTIWAIPKIKVSNKLKGKNKPTPTGFIDFINYIRNQESDEQDTTDLSIFYEIDDIPNIIDLSLLSVTVFSQEYYVNNWDDVLKIAINAFFKYENSLFLKFADSNKDFIGTNMKSFQESDDVNNGEWHYGKNLDPNRVYNILMQIVSYLPEGTEEWNIVAKFNGNVIKISIK